MRKPQSIWSICTVRDALHINHRLVELGDIGVKRIAHRGVAVVAGFRRADVAARVNPAINLDMLVLQRLADNIVRADRLHKRAIDRIRVA
ncbi:MAG: hypothetical protein CR217_00780 [Beijerinckiaceae bacterium]|nr:MAG: hypothetical protein CR217_00780 [Beijerinckiaceae bacterium]